MLKIRFQNRFQSRNHNTSKSYLCIETRSKWGRSSLYVCMRKRGSFDSQIAIRVIKIQAANSQFVCATDRDVQTI